MNFDEAVGSIRTTIDLRRIGGAHVVDHRQLSDDELRDALIKVKPQYIQNETVRSNLERALYQEFRGDHRVLSRLILVDILLDQYEFTLPFTQTEEMVIAFEQSIVNHSNETELIDLACGDKESQRFRNLELYDYVLRVAWDNEDSKSPDEVNLLRKLRDRLNINESDHRMLEAKIGIFPKASNEPHNRSEINDVRRFLQSLGLLFAVRKDDGVDADVVPDEIAMLLRTINGLEIRTESYRELMSYRVLRRKVHLTEVLDRCGVELGRYDTVDTLVDRILRYVPPSKAITSYSPRYGLSSDQLGAWRRDLNLSPSGAMDERVSRIIAHFDQLRPTVKAGINGRIRWYEFYVELANRDYGTLRAQHVIDKDLEIESKFEDATAYLFAEKLNHTPLQQRGSNHPDGLLSLQSNYLMWDNKSRETPVNLRDHMSQFDAYINQADKPVPVFAVIGPDFTQDSETEAVRYHSNHFDRNIVLITAPDLLRLAEEWSSDQNKNREEPFPLGLLAATGRFDRARLGKLF